MRRTAAYTVQELFHNEWEQLSGKVIAEVYALYLQLQSVEKDSKEYGFFMIAILRRLRKRPLVIDKINVEQAVDIFNDLQFLNKPWYAFPHLQPQLRGFSKMLYKKLHKPDDKLAQHTFDHFIYADNEYSSYVVTQDDKYLNRLVATLYQKTFDKEAVEPIAKTLKLDEWQKQLVFFTFSHVRAFVMKRCKTLLPSVSSSEESKPRPTGAMWLKIKHRLAETPAFQGYDKAGSANMYSTLDYLEDLAQIREEQSRKR
jgi:hypothetical protein